MLAVKRMSTFPRIVASIKLRSYVGRIGACIDDTPAEASASDGVGVFLTIYGSEYHAPSLTQE